MEGEGQGEGEFNVKGKGGGGFNWMDCPCKSEIENYPRKIVGVTDTHTDTDTFLGKGGFYEKEKRGTQINKKTVFEGSSGSWNWDGFAIEVRRAICQGG
jgi:hypothetical protein